MGDEMLALVASLKHDKSLRAVVVTGAGKAFSAGGDLDFLNARAADTPANNAPVMMQVVRGFCLYVGGGGRANNGLHSFIAASCASATCQSDQSHVITQANHPPSNTHALTCAFAFAYSVRVHRLQALPFPHPHPHPHPYSNRSLSAPAGEGA